jgi:hypothetical protein
MFDLLDDAHRQANRRAMVRPRYAIFAVLSLLLIGVEVGILIGKRDWDLLDWLAAGCNGLVLFLVFAPLFRELYNFLRDHESN